MATHSSGFANVNDYGMNMADQTVKPDGSMGNHEYFQKREHAKLHEKLDFIVS